MSVELKVFNGTNIVKGKALKKSPELKQLAIRVKAANKSAAEIIIAGKLTEFYPANVDDYFRAKIWENRPDLPQIQADFGVFCSEYFTGTAVWDSRAGEPAAAQSETEITENTEAFCQENTPQTERMTQVRDLDLTYRAYCLVMFGPVEEVTASQRGQMIDIYNDDYDVINPLREQAEAITRESRVLSLPPESQSQCLVWVRRNARENARWPDYKNLFSRWLDTVMDTLPEAHADTGAACHGTAPELPAVCPARAALLNQELNEAFAQNNDQTGRELAAARGEFVPGISDPADPKWVNGKASNDGEKQEVPPALSQRELEIAHALNDLISGHTCVISQEEAEGMLAGTGHPVAHLIPLLIADFSATEGWLSPAFTDDEIHNVAVTVIDGWSENFSVRQNIAFDAIVAFRSPEPENAEVIELSSGIHKEPASGLGTKSVLPFLSYRQQLTVSALQGLCANPAYCHVRHDLPLMAIDLANDVIDMQEGGDAD